ncbi:MAG: signal peptidase I [Candidatus Obscuribacterales bacterium]|nr:signal peptidase I [Candidatus Obscuribacterales bacterium]
MSQIDTESKNTVSVTEGEAQSKPNPAGEPGKTPSNANPVLGFAKELVELVLVTLVLLIAIRWAFAEARYIPSSSMEPTLQINDRILVEKISGHMRKPYQRGEILVFYPPPSEMPEHKDLSNDPLSVLGRLTGLPFLPYEPAFIKRVVGLPGDTLRVVRGVGVYINGQLLDEPYIKEKPNYDLKNMGDIGMTGRIAYDGRPQLSAEQAAQPIVIGKDQLFMMGDNRNNSQDSHVWGFLDQNRVIGRAFLVFWRKLDPPPYPMTLQSGDPDSGH